MVAAAH